MNVLAFDIETVPDIDGGRRLYSLHDLEDRDVARVMFNKRREKTGSEFLPVHLQRVVAISAVYRSTADNRFSTWTLGDENSTEKEVLEYFFQAVDEFSPTLVTWNGGGFDLPVINHRTLINSVSAGRYWEMGEDDSQFERNNYIGRFHFRHTDLMDVLAGYQNGAFAPLDEMAILLGFPGKMGMDGSMVWDQFMAGEINGIRNYCEVDALNTYLVYLRWQEVKGHLSAADLEREFETVKTVLRDGPPHHREFLSAWER
jgi:predicted PolB exonuclease-like 3'-5' exonuclease